MGIVYSGGKYLLDQESEEEIIRLSVDAVLKGHADELENQKQRFSQIVFKQEVAKMKRFLETKHPEQVDSIIRLRGILNHERAR